MTLSGRVTMARTAALFFLSGALIVAIALATPHEDSVDDLLLAAVGGAAAICGGLILLLQRRLPAWSFHPITLTGTALATVAIYAWGQDNSYGPLPYIWVAFFAFYFFSLPAALVHLLVVGAAYAATAGRPAARLHAGGRLDRHRRHAAGGRRGGVA